MRCLEVHGVQATLLDRHDSMVNIHAHQSPLVVRMLGCPMYAKHEQIRTFAIGSHAFVRHIHMKRHVAEVDLEMFHEEQPD